MRRHLKFEILLYENHIHHITHQNFNANIMCNAGMIKQFQIQSKDKCHVTS